MLDGNVHMRPSYWFTLVKSEKDWMAFGSRTVDQVTVEAHGDYFKGALDTWNFDNYDSNVRTFEFHGTSHSLTYITASTPLSAIGALLDAFREEEEQEKRDAEAIKRQQELRRFGGEIDDELVRKIIKWRKKRNSE